MSGYGLDARATCGDCDREYSLRDLFECNNCERVICERCKLTHPCRALPLNEKVWDFIRWVSLAACPGITDLATVGTMQLRAKELLAEKEGKR